MFYSSHGAERTATSSITNSLSGASSASAGAKDAPSSLVSQDDFLKLLTAQLKNQDPLNPVSNSDFTAQLAQFSTLSGVQQLNTSTQQMLALQQISQGASLVGKKVIYSDAANQAARGTVDAVNFQDGKLLVQIGGTNVPSDRLRSILSPIAS